MIRLRWHIGRGKQYEGDEGEQRIEMAQPHRRYVQQCGVLPRQSEAPDQHHETDDRDGGIQALPGQHAQAGNLFFAPVGDEDAHRMHAQENHQAENQHGHRGAPIAAMKAEYRRLAYAAFATCCRKAESAVLWSFKPASSF
ncbi:hypothetical protein UU5_19266 [Rhodanobacter sp. 115]|nr:hypothetical protein UU5_19266 [Rhodanobacter sp. 115]